MMLFLSCLVPRVCLYKAGHPVHDEYFYWLIAQEFIHYVQYLERMGPMHQILIQIIQLQILKRGPYGGLHQIGPVKCVPQLAHDVQLLAFHGSLSDFLRQSLPDNVLISVDMGAIKVAVTQVDGILDSLSHFRFFPGWTLNDRFYLQEKQLVDNPLTCHVPRPSTGNSAPLFNLKLGIGLGMLTNKRIQLSVTDSMEAKWNCFIDFNCWL